MNYTKDTDTVDSIVGAALGALHGASALRLRWIEGLTGRTGESDDGTVQQIAPEIADKYGNPPRNRGTKG